MVLNIDRREFVKTGLAAGLAVTMSPMAVMGQEGKKVRLGFIGVGGRGTGLLKNFLKMKDVEIPAVCDVLEKNAKKAQDLVEQSGRKRPEAYTKDETDFHNLLKRGDVEGVVIATPWRWHIPMAVAAMKAGVYPASEVGPASSLEECWELVEISEKTGVPCMLLENYCYRRDVMAVLNMVRQGLFGELIHCQGGYQHDLRERVVTGKGTGIHLEDGGDYRSRQNKMRNGDIYPTHGLGPLAHCANINRGNKFVYLTSTASKSRGLQEWTEENLGCEHPFAEINWSKGDVITTVIKCQNGETIVLTHNVSLPRPFVSMARVVGTKGIWTATSNQIYLEGKSPQPHHWESFDKYQEEYQHPIWKKYLKEGPKGGHWGTDFLILRDFADCVKENSPPPIDVYDMAAWMAISPLSEHSIATGSAPVEVPDFTRGKWMTNEPIFAVEG